MADSKLPSSDDVPLEPGWVHLANGHWAEARGHFERAIAANATAEAYEGLSWAAWWLDDAEAVFAARDRAYRLYKESAVPAGAARMATWLACDELDFNGAVPVASGWLGHARRLLADVEPTPEHGWLAFFEGYMASATGDTDRAASYAAEAAAVGRRLDVPDLEMLGLALEGSVLVAAADVDEGMRRLDEAAAAALGGEARIPIAGAWVFCFLVTACAAVRDYERASQWCLRIADFADRYGSRYMLAFCRAEYGVVHLFQGDWSEAEALLEASLDDFAVSRPAMTGDSLRALAELRRRQGRFEDADRLIDRAGPSPASQLIRARLAFDRGDPLRSTELVERVIRQLPARRRLDRAAALEVLVCARVDRGEMEEADAALTSLREVIELVGTGALQASGLLAGGLVAAGRGEHEQARTLLEDAVDGFVRAGGRYDAARARIALATSLLALDRADAAHAEATEAHVSLLELGAAPEAARAQRLVEASRLDRCPAFSVLTPREREVLSVVAVGLTNREIAEQLVLSEHTVHRHMTNILRKLELPSRTAATAYAFRHGLIEPPAE